MRRYDEQDHALCRIPIPEPPSLTPRFAFTPSPGRVAERPPSPIAWGTIAYGNPLASRRLVWVRFSGTGCMPVADVRGLGGTWRGPGGQHTYKVPPQDA